MSESWPRKMSSNIHSLSLWLLVTMLCIWTSDSTADALDSTGRDEYSDQQRNEVEVDGDQLSINFQDIPVRIVLQLLAEHSDFNIVVSDSVSGNLTLRLTKVSWQQVFNTILKSKQLGKWVEDGVIIVAPLSEVEEREKQILNSTRSERERQQVISEVIWVKYAKAADLLLMLSNNESGRNPYLSERGTLSVDERTNALLIYDLEPNVIGVRNIVRSLDIPLKQVQIEARIVTVDEGQLDELGVRWGLDRTNRNTVIGGSIEENTLEEFTLDQMLNVNLGSTSVNAANIAFQLATLGSDVLLDLELSAMQSEAKAEVISRPRLMTTNKQAAYIEQGTEIPYFETSDKGVVSVEFKKAVLSLEVTPQILSEDKLILDLNVTQDRPGNVVKAGKNEALAINTQRLETQVLVNDGQTVVLGGIYQYSVTDSIDKVPMLGDIPILGTLFRRTYQNIAKSELLIFVTPTIVTESDFSEVRK